MSEPVPGSGGWCGGGGGPSVTASEDSSTERARLLSAAEGLGISGEALDGLAAVFATEDRAGVQTELARLVEVQLSARQAQILNLIERCAMVQAAPAGATQEAAQLQGQIVELMGGVGPLQAAAAALAVPAGSGACGEGCACSGAATAASSPRIPASRAALAAEAAGGSDIVCTLDGGVKAMRERITQWQDVLSAVTDREPAEGGITLLYEHDEALTVELARLAAAEFACCSFFTFTLIVGPSGMRFTVTAPEEAGDVITSVFGTATTSPIADPTTAGGS